MSDLLIKLWQNGILQLGIWETIYMTLISTFFAYLIGLPVGLILRMTDRDGIHPIGWLNRTLGIIVNALRSIPFIILMVAMLPVAKAIVGTSLGNRAVIVTLVIAAAPYVARMVESAAKEVDAGVIEAALSMGASTRSADDHHRADPAGVRHVHRPPHRPALPHLTGGSPCVYTIPRCCA